MKTVSLKKFAELVDESIQLEDTAEKLIKNKKPIPQELEKRLQELRGIRVVVSVATDQDMLGSM